MTIIVGLEHGGKVWMGGDRSAVAGWNLQRTDEPKVFVHPNGLLIGYTASFRMGQLLRHGFAPPAPTTGQDVDAWVRLDLMEAFQQLLNERMQPIGAMKGDDKLDSGPLFLLGWEGRLYQIGGDLQATRMSDGYASVGSGSRIALGAFAVTGEMAPRPRIKRVLEAVAHHDIGVTAPFDILSRNGGWKGSRRARD